MVFNWWLFICRSISVPYAYQCCAFVGCDSSSKDSSMKKSAGAIGKRFILGIEYIALSITELDIPVILDFVWKEKAEIVSTNDLY